MLVEKQNCPVAGEERPRNKGKSEDLMPGHGKTITSEGQWVHFAGGAKKRPQLRRKTFRQTITPKRGKEKIKKGFEPTYYGQPINKWVHELTASRGGESSNEGENRKSKMTQYSTTTANIEILRGNGQPTSIRKSWDVMKKWENTSKERWTVVGPKRKVGFRKKKKILETALKTNGTMEVWESPRPHDKLNQTNLEGGRCHMLVCGEGTGEVLRGLRGRAVPGNPIGGNKQLRELREP